MSLPKKLGIKESDRVVLVGAPAGFEETLVPLPEHVRFRRQPRPPVDVILFFTRTSAELRRRLPKLHGAMAEDGGLWVAWPTGSGGLPTDLTVDYVRDVGASLGLVHTKKTVLAGDWTGIRFVQAEEKRAASNGAR